MPHKEHYIFSSVCWQLVSDSATDRIKKFSHSSVGKTFQFAILSKMKDVKLKYHKPRKESAQSQACTVYKKMWQIK